MSSRESIPPPVAVVSSVMCPVYPTRPQMPTTRRLRLCRTSHGPHLSRALVLHGDVPADRAVAALLAEVADGGPSQLGVRRNPGRQLQRPVLDGSIVHRLPGQPELPRAVAVD